jgi:hypothetical protein
LSFQKAFNETAFCGFSGLNSFRNMGWAAVYGCKIATYLLFLRNGVNLLALFHLFLVFYGSSRFRMKP